MLFWEQYLSLVRTIFAIDTYILAYVKSLYLVFDRYWISYQRTCIGHAPMQISCTGDHARQPMEPTCYQSWIRWGNEKIQIRPSYIHFKSTHHPMAIEFNYFRMHYFFLFQSNGPIHSDECKTHWIDDMNGGRIV